MSTEHKRIYERDYVDHSESSQEERSVLGRDESSSSAKVRIVVVCVGGPEYEVREEGPFHSGSRGRLLATFLGPDARVQACSWAARKRE